jgi:beta-lactamase regulating signal transducer with metallopeptidase domain
MLQVTVFSLVSACLYGIVVRFRFCGGLAVLLFSLATIVILTLFCLSPWPRWISMRRDVAVGSRAAQIANAMAATTQTDERSSRSNRSTIRGQSETNEPSRDVTTFPLTIQSENRAPIEASLKSFPPGPVILATLAAIAAFVGCARLAVGVIWLWRYRRYSRPIVDLAVSHLVNDLATKLSLLQKVTVHESKSLQTAATAGWRRPFVLLPPQWRSWTANELQAVLAHELAHIKQRHFPMWVFSQLPLVAHYYHPLVHWLARRLRLEQELAADALAAGVFGSRRQYATALAGLALSTTAPRGPFAPLGLFMSRPLLMRRISMLRQTSEHNRFPRKSPMFVLLALVLTAIAVAGMRTTRAEDAETVAKTRVILVEAPSQGATSAQANATERPATSTTPADPPSWFAPPTVVSPYVSGDTQKRPGAVALFQVSRTPPSLANTESEPRSDVGWQILCKTQLAKLKSYYVLQAALRDPQIASLPLIRAQQEPVAWLADSLDVGFHSGSEIMYVRLFGKRDEVEQLTKIVDAVAKAYEDEVVFADETQRLTTRDLLAQTLKKLNEELTEKMQLYHDMAKDMGKLESGGGRVAQEIGLRRLDRIEAELMRLENGLLELETSGQAGNRKFYEQRIAELRKRQEELEASILSRSETSVELVSRSREIEQLQRLNNDLGMRLEVLDVEASAPPRIKKIQTAVPFGLGTLPSPTPVPANDPPK